MSIRNAPPAAKIEGAWTITPLDNPPANVKRWEVYAVYEEQRYLQKHASTWAEVQAWLDSHHADRARAYEIVFLRAVSHIVSRWEVV
jgi:hypothetical protein